MAARRHSIPRIPPHSETELAIRLQPEHLNAVERRRFVEVARLAPAKIYLFCLTLGWSGACISEVLALTLAAIDIESGVASIQTLKRRKRCIVRQVPLPPKVLSELNREFKLRIRGVILDSRRSGFGAGAARRRGGTLAWHQRAR